jgi:iron complex transport system substrate-binding protein
MRRIILSVLACCSIASLAAQDGPSHAVVAYGAGFSIDYKRGYKVLGVKSPWPGATGGFTYILYKRGSPKPVGLKADGFFETPLRRVVTLSTTYIPQIVAIGEADSVIGVDSAAYVNTPELRSRIESGATVETTRNWAPNIELMISLSPDAVFTYGMGNEWDNHPKMAEAGLPIVISGEWNEAEPLARAEWIKFIAAFYDKENLASAYFDDVAREYLRVRALASAKERPSVLVNGPFQGFWTIAGGRSFMARLIADAGGSYLWADNNSSGGLTLSIEAVYARALKADIWLNPAKTINTRADIAALDPRFASLPVVAAGGVWNNNLRMSPGGGNDYFESAILHPDKVLTDLVRIFHPTLLADRPFTYYKKIER